jgi:hypothetical protein
MYVDANVGISWHVTGDVGLSLRDAVDLLVRPVIVSPKFTAWIVLEATADAAV